MFDLSSSKLLILGLVALIVVGPKDLPILLRTIGKYVAMIRRQATEFRAQFDDAMREAELDSVKKDLEKVGQDLEQTVRDAEMSVEREVAAANAEMDAALKPAEAAPSVPDSVPASAIPTPELQINHLNGLDHSPPPELSPPPSSAPVAATVEPAKSVR